MESAHSLVEIPAGLAELGVGIVKPGALHFLVGEGLGGAEAGQAALDLLVDVGGLLLALSGSPAHATAHGHDHQQENGDHQRHDQRQLPADGDHHRQSANDGQSRCQQILGAVVGQLRQLEKIGGQTAHQLAGAVFVVKIEAHSLHMAEQIPADIRLHPDTEGVAIICHDVVQKGTQDIAAHHRNHHSEKQLVHLPRQHIVQGAAGHQRKQQVDSRDQACADHINGKQPPMGLEVAQKYHQRRLALIVFGRHRIFLPLVWYHYTPFFESCKRNN